MIKLDLKREPYWLDLPFGVSIRVKPATTAIVMAARVQTMKEAADADDTAIRTSLLLKNLAVLVIEAWEGIGDDAGNLAAVTPQAVKAFMDLWPIANAFEELYLTPALTLEAEKNG